MAEQIVNEFTVNRPIEEAWPIICDVERIAPCLPGAQLEEIEGDVYRGRVKVKLGAVTAQFQGEATFVERDDVNHVAKLKGKGRVLVRYSGTEPKARVMVEGPSDELIGKLATRLADALAKEIGA